MITMVIKRAEKADLKQIFELQHLAYQSEAKLHDDFSIQPLTQTLEDIEREYEKGLFLKAADEGGRVIGSVRAYSEGNTAHIGKLIVRPEMQSRGIGTKLVGAIEREYPGMRFEIFTGYKSLRTIGLYEHLGYVRFKEQRISDKLSLVFLEKKV